MTSTRRWKPLALRLWRVALLADRLDRGWSHFFGVIARSAASSGMDFACALFLALNVLFDVQMNAWCAGGLPMVVSLYVSMLDEQ